MRYAGIFIISTLLVLAVGCSCGDVSVESMVQPGLQKVEVHFDLNTNGDLPAGNDGFPQVEDMTFVPDGTLLPQSEPPRMVLSSNNWQQVNDVRIYVFRKNEVGDFVYYKPTTEDGLKQDYLSVDDFTLKFAQSPYVVWWGGTQDLNESHSYVGEMQLETGEYTFLAIARDDAKSEVKRISDPNQSDARYQWPIWTEGETQLLDAVLYCADEKVTVATELFSGYTAQTVVVDGTTSHFYRSIFLERAVAGILLYVENIPTVLQAYDPDEELATGIIPMPIDYKVVGLGVVQGVVLSDQVLIADRKALDGRLNVPLYNHPLNPPTPERMLLKIDIPEHATIRNGIYEGTSPDNERHPNSLCAGSFVMPQLANEASSSDHESYDKSLYLVFYGYDESLGQEFALAWVPIRLNAGAGYDSHYYPLEANHFYSIGRRCYTGNGEDFPEEDEPIDLQKGTTADIEIRIDPFWNEYYGGEIGDPAPGLGLDPEWGDHPAGNL